MANEDLKVVGEILRGDGGVEPIYKVPHGRKIDAPGIYDMPMSWYHDDCCVGPSASSSGLRTIINKSPAHFWDNAKINPDREEDKDDEDAKHFRIGRAGHTLMLEPGQFKKEFCTRPPQFDSWRTKDSQKWRAERQAEGFTVLDPSEMLQVHGVAQALRNHPLYDRGILDGDIERSLIWQDRRTGVWLKARPDAIPQGSNIFADLKIVSDARTVPLRKKIYDLGYDVQMALGSVGMHEVLRRDVEEFVLVAVESKRPHAVRIAPIPDVEIRRALLLLRKAIDIFARCWEANHWPSFEEEDNEYLYRHEFAAKKLDEDAEKGRLPTEF